MIPYRTQSIVGTSRPIFAFNGDGVYYVEGYLLVELEVLMRRFGTEQRFDADEMRDWMNRLHAALHRLPDMECKR